MERAKLHIALSATASPTRPFLAAAISVRNFDLFFEIADRNCGTHSSQRPFDRFFVDFVDLEIADAKPPQF